MTHSEKGDLFWGHKEKIKTGLFIWISFQCFWFCITDFTKALCKLRNLKNKAGNESEDSISFHYNQIYFWRKCALPDYFIWLRNTLDWLKYDQFKHGWNNWSYIHRLIVVMCKYVEQIFWEIHTQPCWL